MLVQYGAALPGLTVLVGPTMRDSPGTMRCHRARPCSSCRRLVVRAIAARTALDEVPRVEKVERQEVRLTFPYAYFEQIKRLVEDHLGKITQEEFGAEVMMRVNLVAEDVEPFARSVAELTAGTVGVVTE